MVIAHNMMAMNAQRQFNIVNDRKAKSTEKLSSGYRINRAADDAAGLSISEKMRRQIRGLNRGAQNTEEGISLLQVADGALEEVTDMLHRINELSVQAANGTNSQSDRDAIQDEIGALITEIDRIGDTTEFNRRKLFKEEIQEVINLDDGMLDSNHDENSIVDMKMIVAGSPLDSSISDYVISADLSDGVNINGSIISWNQIKDLSGNTLQKNNNVLGKYSLSYNGLDLSFDVTSDKLDDVVNYLNGLIITSISSKSDPYILSASAKPVSFISQMSIGNTYTFSEKASADGKSRIYVTDENGNNFDVGYNYKEVSIGGLGIKFNVASKAGVTNDDIKRALLGATFKIPEHNSRIYSSYLIGGFANTNTGSNKIGRYHLFHDVNLEGAVWGQLGINPDECRAESLEIKYRHDEINNKYSVILDKDGNTVKELQLTDESKGRLNTLDRVAKGECIELVYSDGTNSITAKFDFYESTDEEFTAFCLKNSGLCGLGGSYFPACEFYDMYRDDEVSFMITSEYDVSDISFSDSRRDLYSFDIKRNLGNGKPMDNSAEINAHSSILGKGIWIQSGADVGDGMRIHIDEMNSKYLGINDIDVSTQNGALKAIDSASDALAKVTANRSRIGAQQNRLEHTYKNVTNIAENTQTAESRIRDTDMAKEMVNNSVQNVLLQAGVSMMSQANQQAQGVLSLLQ